MSQNSTPLAHLWHYTSKEATLGILGYSCIWATSILYLNDADEFHHVRHLVGDWIKRTRQDNHIGAPEEYRLLTGRQAVFVRFIERQLTGQRALHTYVISFSELADDLNQWRSYGSSGGFSLGFEADHLRAIASVQGFELFKCVYDDDAKRALIDSLMEEALSAFSATEAQITDDDLTAGLGIYADLGPSAALSALGDQFFLHAQQIACRIKNRAFQAEQEWRLVSVNQPDPAAMNFRNSKSLLIPYLKLQLAVNGQSVQLAALVAGPSPHTDLNLLSAATLCRAKSISGVKLYKTRLPYRDW